MRCGIAAGKDIYEQLKGLFRYADDRYNSGLFHFSAETGREAPDNLTLSLAIDDKVLKQIIGHLYYPDSPYEVAAPSRAKGIAQHAIEDRGAASRYPSLLTLNPGHRPVPLAGMVADILVSRLNPAIFQHGIDVVVPKRVLSAAQQFRQFIEGQDPALTEAEDRRFVMCSGRVPQRSDRLRNVT